MAAVLSGRVTACVTASITSLTRYNWAMVINPRNMASVKKAIESGGLLRQIILIRCPYRDLEVPENDVSAVIKCSSVMTQASGSLTDFASTWSGSKNGRKIIRIFHAGFSELFLATVNLPH